VLVELATIEVAGSRPSAARSGAENPAAHDARGAGAGADSPVRFESLVLGAQAPRAMAAEFQRLFAFPEVPGKGGARLRLAVGPGALVIAPAGEVDGVEGMAAIAMVARDLAALRRALEAAGVQPAPRGFGIMLPTGATHGVALHITRDE
jgi:hypothetical protein